MNFSIPLARQITSIFQNPFYKFYHAFDYTVGLADIHNLSHPSYSDELKSFYNSAVTVGCVAIISQSMSMGFTQRVAICNVFDFFKQATTSIATSPFKILHKVRQSFVGEDVSGLKIDNGYGIPEYSLDYSCVTIDATLLRSIIDDAKNTLGSKALPQGVAKVSIS